MRRRLKRMNSELHESDSASTGRVSGGLKQTRRRLGSRQDVSPSLSFRWKYFVTRLLYGEDGLFHKQTNSAKYHGGHSCGFPISLKRHEIADPVAMNPWDSASPENGLEHDDTTIHTVAEHGVNLELFTAIPRIVNKQPPAEEHNDPIIPNIADGEDSVPFTTIPHIKNTQSHIDDLRRPGYVIQHRDSLAVNWFDLEHFEEDRYADLISPKAAEHGENSEPSIMPSPSTETQTPAEAPDDSISSKLAERDGEKVSRLLDGCCHAWRVGGPDLLAGLKPMIMEIVRKAVEEALAELLPTPRRTVTVNEDPERARRRGKGKAQGDAVPEPYPSSISGKGRGKEAPKGDKGQNQPNKGKGAGGENGKGAKGKSKPVAPVNDAEDGWVQVVRRKIDKSQTFVLDPADWDAPVIPFCELGERFNKLESGGTLKAIILCKDDQLKTAKVMAAGSKLPHSLTLITTDKKGDERIPGRLDGLRHFITGFIHQVTSEGNTAPRSTGQKAAITIEKTDTTVLFVRVSKLYAKWGWQDFRQSPTKAMMKWASKYEIALVDTWGWQQQRTAQGSDQVFGILRMNGDQVKDALRHSGAEGVFLEPHRQFMATRIEWHTPEQDESHEHFFERVYKLQKELGLATSGQNLGVRFPLQSSDRIQRQWVLQGVPLHWGFPEVTKALQSAFTEIVITASKRGRGDKSIFYKATATLEASRDIVPISVIYDGNEMVLWAKWAPPRHQKVSMRNLRHNIVPVVDAPKILSIPAAKPDEPLTETDDKNKEVPQGKRPKTEEKKRSIPACLQLCAQPRDGNCLFHSLCQGLAWVTKHQKKPLVMTAREMRARLVERLRRHSELYETDHDGLGPSGAPATWKEYLSQIEVEGTYGGQLEVRAFARIFDCRVIVIPEFTAFPCESFHNKAKSRVIATWLTGSPCAHMDLLLPKGASEETATAKTLSLPQEILSIQAPPAVSYRVGGTGSRTEKRWTTRVGDPSYVPRFQAAASSQAQDDCEGNPSTTSGQEGTVWTQSHHSGKQSSRHASDGSVFSGSSRPRPKTKSVKHSLNRRTNAASRGSIEIHDFDIEEDLKVAEARSSKGRGARPWCPGLSDGVAQCPHCPFRFRYDPAKYASARDKLYKHCKNLHGVCTSGVPHGTAKPSIVQTPCPPPHYWKCPLCEAGIPKETGLGHGATQIRIARDIKAHKTQAHPKVKWHIWKQKLRAKRYHERSQSQRNINNIQRIQALQTALGDDWVQFGIFRWPRLHHDANQEPSLQFDLTWYCRRCHEIFKSMRALQSHVKAGCQESRGHRGSRKGPKRLKDLAQAHALFKKLRLSAEERQEQQSFFDMAQQIFEKSSPCSF